MKKYKKGIFIGKFYPFHLGHLSSLEKLSRICEEVYLIFYISEASESKIASQIKYKYRVDQRILDVRDVVSKYKNISVTGINVPKEITFPRDTSKIKALVEEAIGGRADLQIFGEEEKHIYAPHAYADEYILGPIYYVKNKEGKKVSLHAALIRDDLDFYKTYMPHAVKQTLDTISHTS